MKDVYKRQGLFIISQIILTVKGKNVMIGKKERKAVLLPAEPLVYLFTQIRSYEDF